MGFHVERVFQDIILICGSKLIQEVISTLNRYGFVLEKMRCLAWMYVYVLTVPRVTVSWSAGTPLEYLQLSLLPRGLHLAIIYSLSRLIFHFDDLNYNKLLFSTSG